MFLRGAGRGGNRALDSSLHLFGRDGQGTSFQGGFGKEVTPPGNCWLCGTKEQPKGIRHPQEGKTWMGYESQSICDPSPLPS